MALLLYALNNQCKGYSNNGYNLTTAAIVDNVAIVTDNPNDMRKALHILYDFSKITGMFINPNKSAYMWNNTTKLPTPKFNGILFKELSNNLTYKYLSIHISLNLCWNEQIKQSEKSLRASLDIITKKFYLNPTTLVKLINTIAFPSLGYHMQCIQFNRDWLQAMEKATTHTLKRACRTTLSHQS